MAIEVARGGAGQRSAPVFPKAALAMGTDERREAGHWPPSLEGSVLAGKYELIRRIGVGGMGAVFEARQRPIGRRVAVKVLEQAFGTDASAVRRFEQEARLAASLRHPNTVVVHDFGVNEGTGHLYLVMELLEGRTLQEELRRVGRFSPARAARVITQVCASLAEAHGQRIVHRDLKPANIQLGKLGDDDDFVKVLDFGIAKFLGGEPSDPMTRQGTLGTPRYMSPEQIMLDSGLDHRTDVYSLGVILFELLTGRPPFQKREPMAVLMQHVDAPVPSFAEVCPELEVDAGLEQVVRRALEKAPADRFESARALAEALAPWLEATRALAPTFGFTLGTAPTAAGALAPEPPTDVAASPRAEVAGSSVRTEPHLEEEGATGPAEPEPRTREPRTVSDAAPGSPLSAGTRTAPAAPRREGELERRGLPGLGGAGARWLIATLSLAAAVLGSLVVARHLERSGPPARGVAFAPPSLSPAPGPSPGAEAEAARVRQEAAEAPASVLPEVAPDAPVAGSAEGAERGRLPAAGDTPSVLAVAASRGPGRATTGPRGPAPSAERAGAGRPLRAAKVSRLDLGVGSPAAGAFEAAVADFEARLVSCYGGAGSDVPLDVTVVLSSAGQHATARPSGSGADRLLGCVRAGPNIGWPPVGEAVRVVRLRVEPGSER